MGAFAVFLVRGVAVGVGEADFEAVRAAPDLRIIRFWDPVVVTAGFELVPRVDAF